jgi:hypothetical protein
MDYSTFLGKTLEQLGLNCDTDYGSYYLGQDQIRGWDLRLPDLKPNRYLLVHLQDYANIFHGMSPELERITHHYGTEADRVIVTYWNHGLNHVYSGPLNLVEFSSHNYRTAQSLLDVWDRWKDIVDAPRPVNWQCLNGRMCDHRQRAVNILKTWDNGILSYHDIIPLPGHEYSNYRYSNHENFIELKFAYGQAAVNIVTETMYEHSPGIVTEKTQLAIAAQQIPIVIGHRGIVQDCRDMGFDMFDDLVDTSYDYMDNDVRVEQAILRNQDLIQGRINLEPYRARLTRNREYLLHEFCEVVRQRVTGALSNVKTFLSHRT